MAAALARLLVILCGCWVGESSLRERKWRGIFKNDLHAYSVEVGEDWEFHSVS